MEEYVTDHFGDRLRVRVCGICVRGNEILMVKHQHLGEEGHLWAPPGGGIGFGKSAEENLIREIKEETGLDSSINRFLFVNEFLQPPLHAIELFYDVSVAQGDARKGEDPELSRDRQLIQEVRWMTFEQIKNIGVRYFHGIFKYADSLEMLLNLRGYFKDLKKY